MLMILCVGIVDIIVDVDIVDVDNIVVEIVDIIVDVDIVDADDIVCWHC